MIRLLSLTLALLIAVTSQQMAIARGVTTNAAGQVILCTGQGVVTVTLDANGDPIEPAHICPDCALSLLDVVAGYSAPAPWVIHSSTLVQTIVDKLQSPTVPPVAHARGPPVII